MRGKSRYDKNGFLSWANARQLVNACLRHCAEKDSEAKFRLSETHRPHIYHPWLGYFILFIHQWQMFHASENTGSQLFTKITLLNLIHWCISYNQSREKKPNCLLPETLRAMISHLQDWDNEAVTNPTAGRIWGNLSCHHPEGEVSLPCPDSETRPPSILFFLSSYLFLLFRIQVDSSAQLHLVSIWRNARPEDLWLRSFLSHKML